MLSIYVLKYSKGGETMRKRFVKQSGFTLIELLIVIVIIAILAVGAFVALDPASRFADSRDSTRWTDVTAILDAVKVHQVDNAGSYLTAISDLNVDGSNYMIGTDSGGTCSDACADAVLTSAGAVVGCVDLTGLTTGTAAYLASVPTAPTEAGGITRTAGETGYYLRSMSNGSITVGACDSEGTGTTSISVSR